MTKYLHLNSLGCYKRSFMLSNYVWDIVLKWKYFDKNTVGTQFSRAVDSISANIAEGFGRFSKKDKIKFYRYSMGSQKESLDWNEKSKSRGLLRTEEYSHIVAELQQLPREINQLIKFTRERLRE